MHAKTQLWLAGEMAEEIRRHATETYPHECCGALLGRDHSLASGTSASAGTKLAAREVLALFPLINRRDDSPRNRFSVSAGDVVAAEKEAAKQGLDVIGWYHSHPDHPARPSEYDREHAWPWYSYIIVSVAQGAPQEMTSWRLADDRTAFAAEDIEIRQRAAV